MKIHPCMQVVFLTGALVGGDILLAALPRVFEASLYHVRCNFHDTASISRAQHAFEDCLQKLRAPHVRVADTCRCGSPPEESRARAAQ